MRDADEAPHLPVGQAIGPHVFLKGHEEEWYALSTNRVNWELGGLHVTKAKAPGTPANMPRHFLKEWREFRGMSQRQLAEQIDTAHVSIGRYERYETPPDLEILGRIARALNTDVPSILARDPTETGGVWETWEKLSEGERRMLVEAIRGISRGRG